MLVLERKDNESITITTPSGDVIEVCLVEATKGRGKLGIKAPPSYAISRMDEANIH